VTRAAHIALVRIACVAIAIFAVRSAAADPALPHVLTAPTAWLPGSGTVFGTAGLDHRGDASIDVGYGLGELASVELDSDDDVRTCAMPPCTTDHRAQPIRQQRAAFRIGAREDAWFIGQPALVLGVRESFGSGPRVGEAYVVASRELGPYVRVHAGALAIDARDRAAGAKALGFTVRPTAALELTPPQYPKTTLLGDLSWEPRLEPAAPQPEWIAGWGVRYQALRWGAIELAVRHRETEGVAASTVLVRLDGVWSR